MKIETQPVFAALLPAELKALGIKGALFVIKESFTVEVDGLGFLTIPAGMRTDWASIPAFGQVYQSSDDPEILVPSLVHDYLYAVRGELGDGRRVTREQADDVLRRMMRFCGAGAIRAQIVYLAVRLGGGSHWKN